MKALPTFPCGKEGIEALLPHRDPFLWVSRILECEPGVSVVAELDVDPDLPLFQGHFPGYPVLPGVIIMEALAQAASCCLLGAGRQGRLARVLRRYRQSEFREQVRPGDTIRLEANITRNSSRMCVAEVKAYKSDKLCAQAIQKYVLAKNEMQ